MGRFLSAGLIALGVLVSPAGLAAQNQPAAAAADNDIEVQGDRALDHDEIIRGQRHLYSAGRPYRTAPRFYEPVCVSVVGLAGRQNDIVAERIRANVREAGVPLADGACKPNALVAANRRPAALIKALQKRDPRLFNRAINADISSQLAAGRPVIAWGETILRANDGAIIGDRAAFGANPRFDVPMLLGATPSRHPASVYESKVNALVFFDLDRLEDVHVNQLADYATLHLLGNPRVPADHDAAGVPTVLSLFAEGPTRTPLEMTSIDRAYLRGLYQMRSNDWGWQLTASMLKAYRTPVALQDGETPAPLRSGSPS